MKRLISRIDAAKLLQVHPQTISNYAKRGLLTEVKKGSKKLHYYYEEQILGLLKVNEETKEMTESIDRYRAEIAETEKVYNAIRDEWKKKLVSASHASRIFDALISTVKYCTGDAQLTYREKEILRCYLDLKSENEIGDMFGLTTARVRQIFNKAMRRLCNATPVVDRNSLLVAENDALKEQVKKLRMDVETLKATKVKQGTSMEDLDMLLNAEDVLLARHPVLKKNLRDMGLSVRCYNCLKCAGIKTMHDLVKHKRSDIMKYRNFGRKSLLELDLLLEEYDLEYGM